MYYVTTMSATFELEKNRKAFLYTLAIVVALLLIAIFWTWQILPPPTPIAEDLIEINLGNNNEGFGTVQPLIKGEKSPGEDQADQQHKAPPVVANNSSPQNPEPDDSKDPDAAPVVKPSKPTPKAVEQPTPLTPQPTKNTNPTPVVAMPKPQKPKIAGYGGPKSGTGNGADETNGYTYQGNKPGGKGDAGSPSGKPDSYGNNPGGRSSGGASFIKGVRPYNLGSLKFEDDFDENAKVYIDIQYNSSGSFVSATIARGTTTSNSRILSIARQKVAALKFPASPDGGVSTILLNFKIQN